MHWEGERNGCESMEDGNLEWEWMRKREKQKVGGRSPEEGK